MIEVQEVLRAWLSGVGLRTAGERAGVGRKTARRYVAAGQEAGLVQEGGEGQLTDELIGAVVAAVRPARPSGHGQAWEDLKPWAEQIPGWVTADLQLTNIHGKLARHDVQVPYRTLHRFAAERYGFGQRRPTLRVADGAPGVEWKIDFRRLGLMLDPETGRRRALHALIFTAVLSRHMFVHLSFGQTPADVIAGCERAWEFFGGIFKVLVPDNMNPIVADADPANLTFTAGWLDYAQARGFGSDPARVRSPRDKPRVERGVQFVRENFYRGESFADLADAQRRVEQWCTSRAGLRVHGTTAQRPAEHFPQAEAGLLLLPKPAARHDVPIFATPKVARDLHIEIARALYSVPGELIGQRVECADSGLVKVFSCGQLVKTHPLTPAGERSTDPKDYPVDRAEYALRDVALTAKAGAAGPAVGVYAARLLDVPLPWTSMRTVYRLVGLVRSYGLEAVEVACARAHEPDVVDVTKIARMLEQAREHERPAAPAKVVGGPARFARDAGEFSSEFTAGGRR